jgi:hypothetical protein
MPVSNRIVIWALVGILSLGSISSIFSNIRDTFFPQEKTYSLEAVQLMLKHDRLKQEIKDLQIENEIIEKDNERITHNISSDSATVYNSSRAYRDSLRAELFR